MSQNTVIKCLLYKELIKIDKKNSKNLYHYNNAVFINPQSQWLETLTGVGFGRM